MHGVERPTFVTSCQECNSKCWEYKIERLFVYPGIYWVEQEVKDLMFVETGRHNIHGWIPCPGSMQCQTAESFNETYREDIKTLISFYGNESVLIVFGDIVANI